MGSALLSGVSVMPLLVTMSLDTDEPLEYSQLDTSVQSKSTALYASTSPSDDAEADAEAEAEAEGAVVESVGVGVGAAVGASVQPLAEAEEEVEAEPLLESDQPEDDERPASPAVLSEESLADELQLPDADEDEDADEKDEDAEPVVVSSSPADTEPTTVESLVVDVDGESVDEGEFYATPRTEGRHVSDKATHSIFH
jgi:hypothetical protein